MYLPLLLKTFKSKFGIYRQRLVWPWKVIHHRWAQWYLYSVFQFQHLKEFHYLNRQAVDCDIWLQILAMAWSSNGIYLATYSKDSIIRIYEPRASTSPIREGKGPSGGRSGRIVWVLNDSFVAVSGFDRSGFISSPIRFYLSYHYSLVA